MDDESILPVEAFLNAPDDTDDVAMQRTPLSEPTMLAAASLLAPIFVPKELLRDVPFDFVWLWQRQFGGILGFPPPDKQSWTCNLTGDERALGLLYSWSRRPHDEVIPLVLADRLNELNFDKEAEILRAHAHAFVAWIWYGSESLSRRVRQKRFKSWRNLLRNNFGDFETALQKLRERGKLSS